MKLYALCFFLMVVSNQVVVGKTKKSDSRKSDKVILHDKDDTVIVEALKIPEVFLTKSKKTDGSRNGRQFGHGLDIEINVGHAIYPPQGPPPPGHHSYPDPGQYLPNHPEDLDGPEFSEYPTLLRAGDNCVTKKNERGTCAPLKTCYHFMLKNDMDGDGIYEGNMELANMLMDSAGSCNDHSNQVYPAVRGVDNDLICCEGNVTVNTSSDISQDLKTVGGGPAGRFQYPYIVALMNNGRQFCGGSLINANHVLTAAHCINHMGAFEISRITVQLGDYNIYALTDGYHETRRVSRIIKHRLFHPRTLYNDVALLTLNSGVRYSRFIRPVSLSRQYIGGGGTGTVAGWGKLGEFLRAPSVLHHVNVPLISNQACRQRYGNLAPAGVPDSMLCAGGQTVDACNGDSGGPLLYGGYQIGIVSWGVGCGRLPGVYTRVSSYLDWIQKNSLK